MRRFPDRVLSHARRAALSNAWTSRTPAGRSGERMSATFVPLTGYTEFPPAVMVARATEIRADLGRWRTVREFSERPF